MSTTSLIVIQPTPFCNIDCSYCYLPNRRDKTTMPIETIEEIFRRVLAFPTVSGQVTVVWHAGEPLVLGVDYYEQAFSRIRALCPPGLKLDHSFQTNALLLNEAWCDFIQRWDVKMGVSVDGPAHIHDLARRTRAGKGTQEKAVQGLNLLKSRGIPYYVITVLTRAAFADPDALFGFYRDHAIPEVGFNIEETEGAHLASGLASNFDESMVTRFYARLRELMEQHQYFITIRELEEVAASIRYLEPSGPMNSLVTPFGIITIDVKGGVYTFSPELAGFSSPDFPSFAIGNILEQSYDELRQSPVLNRMVAEIEAGIAMCRAECDYFAVCGGGTPSNKVFENGAFASSETLHCRLTRKRVADYLLGVIEEKMA